MKKLTIRGKSAVRGFVDFVTDSIGGNGFCAPWIAVDCVDFVGGSRGFAFFYNFLTGFDNFHEICEIFQSLLDPL